MPRGRRRGPSKRLLGLAGLLLLLLLMLPLGAFLPGLLPGGGRIEPPDGGAAPALEAGTLRVTVLRSEDQAPVEGARIVAAGPAGGGAADTDAHGKAVLEGLGAGPVRVEASHGDRKAVRWADPSVDGELQLAVGAEPERHGRVRDADGQPVRAVVHLVGRDGETLDRTETDPGGRYALVDDPRAVAVAVDPASGAPASVVAGDVVVAGGRVVSGRLAGAAQGALDIYGVVAPEGGDDLLPLRGRWTVDADGRFEGRLPGDARAWAVQDGRPVRVRDGDLELPAAAEARGAVTLDGRAVKATLVFRVLTGDGLPAPVPPVTVETDDAGRFVAPGLARVPYAVEVRGEGAATTIFGGVVPGATEPRWQLVAGFAISGTVVDPAGLPVADVELTALGLPESGARPLVRGRADGRGRFELAGLGGESARLHLVAPGFWPTTLDRVRPGADVRVVLQRR